MGEIIRAFEAAVALAIVVVLVLVPGVAAANGTVVGIEAPAEVDEGGSFTARVIIDSVVDFDACNYDVTYDPAVIEVTDVTAGTINGTPIPVDLWGFIPSGVQGTVRVVQNVPLIPGVSGSGFLAEIHFDVVGAGGSSSAIDLGNGVMGDNYALEIIAGWTDGLVTVAGGGDGGSAPPSLPEPGVTPVETDDDGVFVEEGTAVSEEGSIEVTIAKGTTGLTGDGEPLTEITVVPLEETPPPPEDTNVIGLNYDIGPDGATFDQAVTICFTYDPGEVPDGVEEEDLVVAVWDEGAGEWVDLEGCVVDTEAHRVCASVTHFTAFSMMAHTAPALFITESLVISPGSVEVGQMVTIVVTVTNLGDLEGSHEVVLKLDDIPSGEVVVMLGGGESREVSFSVSRPDGAVQRRRRGGGARVGGGSACAGAGGVRG